MELMIAYVLCLRVLNRIESIFLYEFPAFLLKHFILSINLVLLKDVIIYVHTIKKEKAKIWVNLTI